MLGDNKVTISVNTNYPFGMDLSYSISADDDFTFYVRIPSWANPSSTTTGPSGDSNAKISPSGTGLQKFAVPKGQSKITVSLQTEPRIVERANNTAAVYYGPLLYSLALEFNETTRDPVVYYGGGLVDASSTTQQTRDHIVETTDLWNIAIDPSQIKVVRSDASTLSNPIWAFGGPPLELRVAATEIDWPISWDSPTDPPNDPQAKGKPFSARFVPFASAKVHMAHLPKMELDKVEL
jgi:hypothetical protein